MCGIAGYLNPPGRQADSSIVQRMIETISHRGPDGDGIYLDGIAGLGHRRLSIIDVGGGAQPMSNEDGQIWVTFNGEIYNEPGLRANLIQRGHQFRTQCDTESLVHLYEEHGPNFVSKLNGMFAFALWDSTKQRLMLARDRMGQKPLYYALTSQGSLIFGSEPKAILAHPEMSRQLDQASLARYLFCEYVPAPYSIWEGMNKLPCGHWLIFENQQITIQRYWTPDPPSSITSYPDSFEKSADKFWSLLVEATARHRRSDVPLGVFLSGGVDSSSVVAALAASESASSIRTYSIGFDDPSFDESVYARLVANHLGTNHHEKTFQVQDVLNLLPEAANWLDEPFGDASVLPTHLLCRFARENVTVALGGDGADELWAGYPTFSADRGAGVYRRLPQWIQAIINKAGRALPVDHRNFSFDFKVKQFLRGAHEPISLAHQLWLGSFSGCEIANLLVDPPKIDVESEWMQRLTRLPKAEEWDRLLWLYQDAYLPEDILTKVDRASMACSLEVRAPLLDAELVDYIQRLPSSWKFAKGQGKRLFKLAVAGRLPEAVLKRPKKGFGIPVARWLRGPLAGLLEELLNESRLSKEGLFRPKTVRKMIEQHQSGAVDHRKPLWTLLMFQLWRERWLT